MFAVEDAVVGTIDDDGVVGDAESLQLRLDLADDAVDAGDGLADADALFA